MAGSVIIKGIVNKQDINTQERTFGAWASVEIIDKQGDYIAMSEFRPALEKLMASGRRISINDSHTNHVCGYVQSYTFKVEPTSGKEGLYITAKIYTDYDSDTDIWNAVLDGRYSGISLGGKAGNKQPVCGESGCYNILTDIEIWEFSLVETPANQNALIDNVNKLAKSHQVYKAYPIIKYIRQCDGKWCVYSEGGKKLGTHSSKEDANQQLRAIEVNKTEEIIKYLTYRGGLQIDHDTEESVAPDGSRKPLTEKEHAEMVRTEEKLKKARVYVKNPSQVPSGHKVSRGPHGGYYYETEQRTDAQEAKPQEKRNIAALNPRVYNNYDKLLHFETGQEVLLSYLHNTEKAPDMGSRFGQDIEPTGKYVIIDELGQDAPPGWEKKAQILYNPLVLDWKNWKQRLSEFYNGKTGKNLSAALIEDGFDSIVTIDDQNVSEIVLLKPKISSYDELKTTKNYRGTMTVRNEQNQDIEHDIFQFENVNIEVPTNDIPDGAHLKVLECSEAFKYSLLKKPPVVRFLGKSYHSKFKWQDRDGQEHESEYGGTADYTNDEIAIYDNFALYGILHHEVGHFVYKRIMDNVVAIPETPIKALTYVDKIEDYNNTLQILKNHNITLNENLINSILDNVDTVRNLGIMDDLHAAKLAYYDNAYGAFCAMRDRMRAGYTPELSDFEIKQWKKWKTLRDAELKSQELRNEWLDVWKTEGYKDKEYANRNNGETFAEFYQTLDQRLRNTESHEQLSEIQKNHPLKYGFFKKYVLKKWLK